MGTSHVQMLDICKHAVASLQMCTSLVTFANIICNVCKYLHHMQMHICIWLIGVVALWKNEWLWPGTDWVRGRMRQSIFFTNVVLYDVCKRQKWLSCVAESVSTSSCRAFAQSSNNDISPFFHIIEEESVTLTITIDYYVYSSSAIRKM